MQKRKSLLFLGLILFSIDCLSQNFQKEINDQIWRAQLEAMKSNRPEKFMETMSAEVIQVSYDRKIIRNHEEFSQQAIETYKRISERKLKRNMEFRFLNRIATEAMAFEDGYFKYELINEKSERQVFYGYFQVTLRKENGTWKVLVDYDAEKFNGVPVTLALFNAAKSMDSFD